MPQLTFSNVMTANQLGYNPLSGWQFETVPYQYVRGAAVKVLSRSTDVNVRITITSGSQTIQERSPVQGSGTAGLTPTDFTTSPALFVAGPGDRIKLSIDEVAGGTPTVDGLVILEPM